MIRIMSNPLPPAWGRLGAALRAQAKEHVLADGEALFRQGQRPRVMHLVLAGEAVMQRATREGDTLTLQVARAGQWLAEASLTSASYHCDGIARGAGRVLLLPVPALRSAIDHDEATRWAWITMLGQQARQQRLRTERLALKSIRERLRHLLLTEGDGNAGLEWPSTWQALAAELAVAPAALYRALRSLQQQRLLALEGRRLRWCG